MKQLKFLETKRTPRYSLRKFSVGMVSVLLGVTIFGINFTNHSVKAATTNGNSQQTSAVVLTTAERTNTQKATGATGEVQQSSASNNATANNSTEAATTPQSSPKTQGSADTDIKSSAAKLEATNLVATSSTDRNAAGTVDQNNTNTQKTTSATEKVQQGSASNNATANNPTEAATTSQSSPETQGSADTDIRSLDIRSLTAISAAKLATMNLLRMNLMPNTSAAGTVDKNHANTQSAKENQELANKTNLTSSDNYSSNIYEGTDGKYYKIITIYGNDYVYHAADIQANGTATWQKATTAEDTKNNIHISKEDLGNGKTRWTVVFFPNRRLQNGSTLNGLVSAKFGIALTSDYQIVGSVDMDVISDSKHSFMSYTFERTSTSANKIKVQNPSPKVHFSFNPKTDVDQNTGLINSVTMPAYNNKYLQGPYYFTTATGAGAGANNLWQTYFEDGVENYNAYDKTIPYLGGDHDFHLNNFEIKNETGVDGAEFKDPIIYDTLGQRLNRSGEPNSKGVFSSEDFNQAMEFKSQGEAGNTQFSSYVISFTTQHTDSYEVNLAKGPKNQQFSGIAANIYSFQDLSGHYYMFSSLYGEQRALNAAGVSFRTIPLGGTIKVDKDAQLTSTDAKNAITNAGKLPTGTTYSWDVKKLPDTSKPGDQSAVVVVKYPDTSTTDNVNVTVHVNGDSDKITPNVPATKVPVADPSHLTKDEKDKVKTNVTDANKDILPSVSQVTVGDDGKATLTYKDGSQDTISGDKLVRQSKDADKITPNVPATKVPVADPSHLTKDEKDKVKTNVTDANKDILPSVSQVTVGDDGKATLTYKDGSQDTISGDKLVRQSKDADKITPNVPATKVPVADPSHLTKDEKDKVKTNVTDANKDILPSVSQVTVGDDGKATLTYKDGSQDTISGDKLVRQSKDADKITPNVPATKVPVADPSHLTKDEKDKVKTNVTDANKDILPSVSQVTVGDDGKATLTYKDGSQDTISGDKLVRQSKDADKITPNVPATKVPVADPSHLTKDEKDKVKTNVTDANKDILPSVSQVTVGDDGKATLTYKDGSQDTISGDKLVRQSKDADKITPNVPATKVPVADPSHLTKDEKDKVKTNVTDANKDILPSVSQVTVGDDGKATLTYKDGSQDTISGDKLVRQSKDADKITPNVPATKVPVADPSHLTKDEKDKVKTNVTDANKDILPSVSQVTVGDDGKATLTYKDGSQDTISGDKLVRQSKDADKITPNVPATKVPVADPSHLTKDEKDKVKTNVTDANKDILPSVSQVTVGDDGKATLTYKDGSQDTISGDKLVRQSKDADKITPNVPATKVPVADPSHLTKDEKDKVKTNVTDANKDILPSVSQVTVGDDGKATLTYKDGSQDTISGDKLVRQSKDADKITPNVPATKVPVADPSHLTKDEKDKVKTNVTDANKDILPSVSQVTVGDDGKATLTYKDGSQDTISGDKLVRQSKDADKITPNVPATKVPVADPSHLTKDEKDKVKTNVTDANKDILPSVSQVTVGDDGKATLTYKDGSQDTISGDKLVRQSKDADKITPNVPATKVPVADPSHLTKDEKDKVKTNVTDANKDILPSVSQVTVGDDGKATLTYKDGSQDTISGDKLVRQSKDADKITPNVPATKVPVADPSHLTKDEKDKVKTNVTDANKDILPSVSQVTVGDDGKATLTYKDGSQDTISGDKLVRQSKDADKITPNVPATKVPVADPSHLTKDEKDKVKTNVTDANKDILPSVSQVTVGDDGKATLTYKDGSQDTISGDKLVRQSKDADKITPNVPATKVPVADPSHLTKDEKDKVKTNVTDANKDILPSVSQVTVGDDGKATLTYKDGSQDTISGDKLVRQSKDADKITPNVPATKVPVADPSHLTKDEKDKVKTNVTDANKDILPSVSQVTVGDDGKATLTYKDGSQDTISGDKLVRQSKDADKITPNVPATKVPVADPSHLTKDEKDKVKTNVTDANKDILPSVSQVTVGDDGKATLTYKDGSQDTISGDKLVRQSKDADKITPNVPATKVPVADPSHLTKDEKDKVKTNVTDANKDILPSVSQVTVGDDGKATLTYKDGSQDTISGDKLVRQSKDADKITPNVPATKVPVADPSHLTKDEKDKVKTNVTDANKDILPSVSQVTVGDDGKATLTYKDGSQDTISGDKLVRQSKDADKITPNVPATKVPVADPSHLTKDEKDKVKTNVTDANKDILPSVSQVTVGDDGKATLTYKDGSQDTISGDKLVRQSKDADKITPNVPATKVPVADPSHLTKDEKDKVKTNVTDANKDILPSVSQVTVGDDGKATLTYKDGSQDTISGDKLVRQSKDADKITPNVPATKVPVADPSHLTKDEKDKVKTNVTDANKDILPSVSQVTVGDDGKATLTYKDGSQDTISGDKLVRQSKDADKITPNVPATKVPVADPSHLTKDEKDKVKTNVTDANKDILPSVSQVTVGDDGKATLTYKDGSQDTISGDKLVRQSKDADKITPNVPATKVPVADPSHLTKDEKDKVKTNVTDANKDILPSVSQVTVGDDGKATLTYKDGSQDTISGDKLVRQSKDADKITPNVPATKVPVADPSHLTKDEKDKVKTNVTDANKDILPSVSQVTVGDDGKATLTYKDGSQDTISGDKLVRQSKDADKITPNVPATKVPVADPSHLTKDEKDKVKTNVTDANKDILPSVSQVTVGDDGKATLTYKDGSQDTISGDKLVRQSKDADKITPNVPATKVPVADPSHLTKDEKDKVKTNVTDANKDILPSVSQVTVGDDGKATLTYKDGSQDTISGDKLVRQSKDADKITPNVPATKVPVADPSHLTKDEKDKVKTNVTDANKDILPSVSQVTVGDDGKATLTYKDGSQDTISGDKLVRQSKDADKITPNVPATKVPVADPSHLTKDEKDKVKTNVTDANKDILPSVSQVTVGDDGKATLTYKDGSQDTISGDKLVRQSKDADKITPNVPATKVPVADPSHLTKDEKDKVKTNVTDANKDILPSVSQVTVGDDGKATLTYKDGSQDTISGDKLVRQSKDADKITPNVPATKVPVADPSHLTKDEKDKVKTNVTDANKDILPSVSQVTVGDDGKATLTYKDGSQDTISGDKLVRQSKDADKITPNVPATKVPVADPSHLTKDEKDKVKTNVTDANKDILPSVSQVTVGDDGKATLTYKDGSQDTISGDKLVRQSKDADKITPNVPATKVPVADPSHLTKDEKDKVKTNVTDANKDILPSVSQVTVGDDGKATLTYKDGSQDTISGDKLVQGQKGDTTDAGNITPTIPGGKVTVKDPSHLTDDEKNQVKDNVDNANKGNFPAGTEVTVGDDGTATIKYPDGSKDTIPGDQLVQGQKGDTTDAGNITPTISGGKVTVKDPSHLTDDEKNQVKKNVEDANKDKFPAGTEVTVGDDGTTTVTYPDGSKDVIAGTDLVIAAKGEDVLGSRYHSHKNGSNSSQADRVKGASTANGSIANAGNNLGVKGESDNAFVGVKGESDNAIGNNKATSLKTLPQTGTKDTSILGVLGMLLASLGLFGFKKKRDKE